MYLPLDLALAPFILQCRTYGLEVIGEAVGEADELRYLAPQRFDLPLTQVI